MSAKKSSVPVRGHRRSGSKNNVSSSPSPRLTSDDTANKHMNDRLLFALTQSIGKKAQVSLSSGAIISGLLISHNGVVADANSSDFSGVSVALKFPKPVSLESAEIMEMKELSEILVISGDDLVDIEIFDWRGKDTELGDSSFKTDADISRSIKTQQRELQRWVPESNEDELAFGIEDQDKSRKWDQFEVNERKFGISSTYDESLYTTAIDKSRPDYEAQLAKAEKIAREIEKQGANGNVHLAEERGLVDDSGMDEEDKYSGVARGGGGGELMDILRSAGGSAKAQVKPESHNDPAIISTTSTTAVPRNDGSALPKHHFPKHSKADKHPEVFMKYRKEASKNHDEISALREFSENFKIPHKMPQDLLPILSKDKAKQEKIIQKAQLEKQAEKEKSDKEKTKEKEKNGKEKTEEKIKQKNEEEKNGEKSNGEKENEEKTASKRTSVRMNPHSASFSPSISKETRYSPAGQHQNLSSHQKYSSSKRNATPAMFFGTGRIPNEEAETTKLLATKFNPFKALEPNESGIVEISKPFITAPTWDFEIDESYRNLLELVPEKVHLPQQNARMPVFYPPSPMTPSASTIPSNGSPQPMMPPMMRMAPPMFDPMMGSGFMMPQFMPPSGYFHPMGFQGYNSPDAQSGESSRGSRTSSYKTSSR